MGKINIAFLILIFFQGFNLAQTYTNRDYFPAHDGDMWEYFYSDGPMYVDTVQVFNHYDSTDTEGNVYITQTSRYINPIKVPGVPFNDTMRYKIDTLNQVWGTVGELKNVIAFKLNAKDGDKWVLKTHYDNGEIMGYEMAKVNLRKDNIFGKEYDFMNVIYYYVSDTTDTLGLSRYGQTIVKGLGTEWLGGGDVPGQVDLIGAVINGVLYGDTTQVTGIENSKRNILPFTLKLKQNYPNPFNPSTTINYSIPQITYPIISSREGKERSGKTVRLAGGGVLVTLKVYNILGQEVTTLVNKKQKPGNYQIEFNAENLPSGVYIYKIKADGFTASKKMTLLK